jgi:hypothetical protein
MVKDDRFSKPRIKHMKRRRSWKDVFRDFASSSDRELNPRSGPQTRRIQSAPHSPNNCSMGGQETPDDDVGALADAENDGEQDEDDGLGHLREEDLPISARVRYAYPYATSLPVSRRCSMLDHGQQLSAALEGFSDEATDSTEGRGLTKGKEPVGTRLTMTSRTGYFQDRVISPSLVRSLYSTATRH